MMPALRDGGAKSLLNAQLPFGGVGYAWLGQAGFLLCCGDIRVLIDPYLSDHLAVKYAGKPLPHARMMPAPIDAADLMDLTAVLCTHRHSDHMDPVTLPALARNNHTCRFIVPAAELQHALELGLPVDRTTGINARQSITISDRFEVIAVPAAHEELKTNERGEHHFLGYVIHLGTWTIYHSGDCVPYSGWSQLLAPYHIDAAFLPVNGRSEDRRSQGVPGNMTFEEAAALCIERRIPLLVPHHFGLFDFNTVPLPEIERSAQAVASALDCQIPDVNPWYELGARRS